MKFIRKRPVKQVSQLAEKLLFFRKLFSLLQEMKTLEATEILIPPWATADKRSCEHISLRGDRILTLDERISLLNDPILAPDERISSPGEHIQIGEYPLP